MAKYQSRYYELSFYFNGVERKFNGGEYATDDAAEIAVLDSLADAVRVDEPVAVTEETAAAPKAKRSTKASAQ